MAIRVVQLGSARRRGEGLRVGTVRRPPRGVPKSQHATRDFFDVWLPDVAPTADLIDDVREGADPEAGWRKFERRYRAQLKRPQYARLVELLAALSHRTNLSIGCYCADEQRCHRSILKEVLREHRARLA